MQSRIAFGPVAGVHYRFHYSWILVLCLIVISLTGFFQEWYPGWSWVLILGVASIIGLSFSFAMVLQCLILMILLRMFGYSVNSGLLYALGYFPQETRNSVRHNPEWTIAVCGWILKVVFGALFIGWTTLAYGMSPARIPSTPLMVILVWLGNLHYFLAAANLLPGYPLDGGRLLSAVLYAAMKNHHRARSTAVFMGQLIAVVLMCSGVMFWLAHLGSWGFWMIAIGMFLYQAAGSFK